MAPKTSEVPRSGWMSTSTSGGPARSTAPTMVHRLVMPRLVVGDPGGQHDGHQDLGHLRELELEAQDGDPARDATDAGADGDGQHQQADVDEVQQPREGAQPAVVDRGRDA